MVGQKRSGEAEMTKREIGVLLVDNFSPHVSDKEIYSFFKHVDNVTDINITHNGNGLNEKRFCWVNVQDTPETIRKINKPVLGDERLNIRLMGYYYPDH
jgi:hypothetical protein